MVAEKNKKIIFHLAAEATISPPPPLLRILFDLPMIGDEGHDHLHGGP
jgi:hypothetical protein